MKKPIIYHPLLFALYPILTLYAYNIEQLPIRQTLIPTGIVLAATVILFLILKLIIKDGQKSALILSAFVLQFFAYGHLNDFIRYFSLLAFLIGAYYLLRTRRDISKITNAATIFSIGLVIVALSNIAISKFSGGAAIDINNYKPGLVKPLLDEKTKQDLPDIYFIMLDGYARADILRQIYRYDNSDFRNFLSEKGFHIAEQSRSNYCQTLLSLTSTFNMIYLDKLAEDIGVESEDRKPLMDMVRHNYVFDFLKQYDYKIMAIASGYSGTEIRNADYYLSPGLSLDEFENALINYTPIPRFMRKFPLFNQYGIHRNMVKFAFEKLIDLPETDSPKIVMAPIVSPHPPFVFGPNGEELNYDREFLYSDGSHFMGVEGGTRFEYIKMYNGQVQFISNQVKKLIDTLLSRPGRKPVIILQGDHGPGSLLDWESLENTYTRERLSIFNAYYLPDGDSTMIYNSITPVNSFRTIFNHYFGTEFELLEDRSNYTKWSAPYKFYDVTELMNQDVQPQIMFR